MKASTLPRPQKSFSNSTIDRNQTQRPHTTIQRKRPRTSIKFMLAPGNNFGKDAPKFTIASSRKEEVLGFPFPGPGQYEINDISSYRKIDHIFPRSNQQTAAQSLTANVDFSNNRTFPEIRELHIFNRNNSEFYDLIESPGPDFVPKTIITQIPHKISEKKVDRSDIKNAHIGPGSYTIKYPNMPREPSFNFYGPKKRDDWIVDGRNMPGPGQYEPKIVKKSEPRWTIGRKSRLSRRSRSSNAAKKRDLIAVDQCLIRLDALSNPSAARQYIMTHQSLRDVVHEIIEAILKEKPDDPVAYLEDYFNEIKKFMKPKEKKQKKSSRSINSKS